VTEIWNLPSTWLWASIEEIAATTSGGTPRRDDSTLYGGSIPWIKSGELKDGPIFAAEEYITQKGLDSSSAKLFPKGTVCIALYGATVGKLGILSIGATTNQAVCGIFPSRVISPRFLFRFLQFIRPRLVEQGKGGAQPNISQGIVRRTLVPVPPLPEQKRIEDETEKQFTRLDAAVGALKRVQANLKRYRAAVLKAAVEGKTVAQSNESVLPTGWRVDTIQNTVKIIDYRGRTPPFSESGIPHLRSSNIRRGRAVWDDLAYVSPETYEAYMTRGLPEPGDILFTTEAPLGEVAPAPTDQKFSVAQRIMILRPKENDLDSRFLMYQIISPQFQAVLYGRGTGTTVTGVSSRNFRPAQIVVPPLDEQQRIVAEVERRLSVIEELEMQVEANLKRAERLRQAILKRAFEGKLVPQDPADEPATVLLARIRAEREAKKHATAGAKKGKHAKPPRTVAAAED